MDSTQAHSAKELNELNLNRKLLQCLLVSCIAPSKISMMPLAPTSTELPTAHKPKIGFSIDSIVGSGERNGDSKDGSIGAILINKSLNNRSQSAASIEHSQTSGSPSPEPSFANLSENKSPALALLRIADNPFARFQRQLHHHHQFLNSNSSSISISNGSSSPPLRPIPISNHNQIHHHQHPPLHHYHHERAPLGSNSSSGNSSPGLATPPSNHNPNHNSIINSSRKQLSGSNKANDPASPPVSTSNNQSRSPSPQPNNNDSQKSPVSSSSEAAIGSGRLPSSPHNNGAPTLHPGMPGAPLPHHPHGLPQFAGYPPGMLNFAVAAAAAAQAHHHHQQHHPGPHPGMQGWMPPPHPGAPHHPHPATAHPLYPWLLAKHSRLFPHRFGPGPDLPGFLLQPFRKPKRIRTAFSPSQLLKLEHAFERNHYVVGAERKQLANSLSLSETQVKVWFQNRRTKHKRMQQEEESAKKGGSGSGHGSSGSNLSSSAILADSSTRNYVEEMSDDEEIIMDEEYTDEEAEMKPLHRMNANHQ